MYYLDTTNNEVYKFIDRADITESGVVLYNLTKEERGYLLNLISRIGTSEEYFKEPLFGLNYKVNFDNNKEICRIISDDGTFTLPSLSITFAGDYNG